MAPEPRRGLDYQKNKRRSTEFEIKISGPSDTEVSGALGVAARGRATGPSWPFLADNPAGKFRRRALRCSGERNL